MHGYDFRLLAVPGHMYWKPIAYLIIYMSHDDFFFPFVFRFWILLKSTLNTRRLSFDESDADADADAVANADADMWCF